MNDDSFLVNKAVGVLKQGGIIIFPTDTAFGIGCRIDKEEAIKKLFRIRKRPESQAMSVLVSGIKMAEEFLSPIPENLKIMMEKHWPGALTIIYYCQTQKVSALVRANSNTLGVRMPNHRLILSIINCIGLPLLGPSANFHGMKTPYKFKDIDKELIRLVDMVIPGECSTAYQSTVLDCTEKPFKIIRQGALNI